MVVTPSAAGANAPGPSLGFDTFVALRWPSASKLQPSRPRATNTQPPPSVVMSQTNWAGRSMEALSSQ